MSGNAPPDRSLAYADLPYATFRQRWHHLPTQEQRDEALRLRFRHKRDEFLKYCFPLLFSRPFNRYHRHVLSRPKIPWQERQGRTTLRVDAAPRGIAKTTIAKGDLVHDVCYAIEGYIGVLSSGMRLSRAITKHLRKIFLGKNSPLARLYGPFIVAGGCDEFTVTTRTGHQCGFLARSFGTPVRGANEEGVRFTKLLVDDGESSKRVRKPELRRQDWEFFHDDTLAAGPIEGGLVVDWRGTILHRDALLPNLLKSPGAEGAIWKSLESWPARQDLWDRCKRIFCDLALGSPDLRYRCALAFYQANRLEMDRGAKMLDDAAFGLFAFYIEVWTKGMRSVLRERQNEPDAEGSRFFESKSFTRCRVETRRDGLVVVWADDRVTPASDLRVSIGLDPIPGDELATMGDEGGAGASDYAAIACVGRDTYGFGAVLDVWRGRVRDSEQLARLWAYAEKWRAYRVSIEANGFQRILGREFRRQQALRREQGKYCAVTVEKDREATSHENKKDRISSLEAPISVGWLQFAEHIDQGVLNEFDAHPNPDHDDGSDAIERAYRLSGGSPVRMATAPLGAPSLVPTIHPRSIPPQVAPSG